MLAGIALRGLLVECSLLLLLFSQFSLYFPPITYASSELDSEIGNLVEHAGELHSKGLNVSAVTEKLNSAIVKYEENSTEEARRLIAEARGLIENMSTIADRVYFTNMARKALVVAALASIP
ncbi:MAG: hypothetical protein ACO2OR_03020, partial [Desulfurococcaceae archaeon]